MKLISVLMLVLATSGCYTIHTSTGPQRYLMLQVGVVVGVVNNCAPYLALERAGAMVIDGLPYGNSTTVALESAPFSGSSRPMTLTVKGYTARGDYLGSQTKTFYANTYEGTREEVWEIDYLQLPNGRGGCH